VIGFLHSVSSYFYIRQTEEEELGRVGYWVGLNVQFLLAKCAAFSSISVALITA